MIIFFLSLAGNLRSEICARATDLTLCAFMLLCYIGIDKSREIPIGKLPNLYLNFVFGMCTKRSFFMFHFENSKELTFCHFKAFHRLLKLFKIFQKCWQFHSLNFTFAIKLMNSNFFFYRALNIFLKSKHISQLTKWKRHRMIHNHSFIVFSFHHANNQKSTPLPLIISVLLAIHLWLASHLTVINLYRNYIRIDKHNKFSFVAFSSVN